MTFDQTQSFSTAVRRPQSIASHGLLRVGRIAVLAFPVSGFAQTSSDFERVVAPVLDEYCIHCHSTDRPKGDVDLERFTSRQQVLDDLSLWEHVREKVKSGEMPPKERAQPTAAARAEFVAWIEGTLSEYAQAHAGDPGPVVLRRLSNAEYTYTVRDLTGVESLDPAREFPVDGAAGEGFTNVGNALVMSPDLLTKYLAAGEEIASHAMLLRNGIRFSAGATRRDQSEEILAAIRAFYRRFTDPGGGEVVNLQGIVFTTNEGGRLPLEKYLVATFELRDAANRDVNEVARTHGLSAKYLATLYSALSATNGSHSPLLDPLRATWRSCAANEAGQLVELVAAWQKALWKFSTIGHIGKAGGPKAWMEAIDPLTAAQELRVPVPAADTGETATLHLIANDAGDGDEHDVVEWQSPRFVAPGKPDLLLRDLESVARERRARRERMFGQAAQALEAIAELDAARQRSEEIGIDAAAIGPMAARKELLASDLTAWLRVLGLSGSEQATNTSLFTAKLERPSEHAFITGWGTPETPLVVANASDQSVRIPGTMKPHGIAVHPSPQLRAVVLFRAPIGGSLDVAARIKHAHPDCGNGVEWSLELRRGSLRRRLAQGLAQGGAVESPKPFEDLRVREGDVLALSIGARDGNHSCDLTAVDLTVALPAQPALAWDLARDCADDLTTANPHPDRFGHDAVWTFATEPDADDSQARFTIPAGSILARFVAAEGLEARLREARAFQAWLASADPGANEGQDAEVYRQLASLSGPLLADAEMGEDPIGSAVADRDSSSRFGVDLAGNPIAATNLVVRAPSQCAFEVPLDLVAGREFVTTGTLAADTVARAQGSVQLSAVFAAHAADALPSGDSTLRPSGTSVSQANLPWTSNRDRIHFAAPIVVSDDGEARTRLTAAFDEFRALFPAALCYTAIVPVDEVVTLTQFHREDDALVRLMLDDTEKAQLEALWSDLHFVTEDALTQVDAFEQIYQFATQDADPKVFEPLREPIRRAAERFREERANAEPRHLEAVLEFADRAWRRPLGDDERTALRALYPTLREEGLSHEDAIRLMIARVLIAPAFLYHREIPGSGRDAVAVDDFELASRLSYFLWSSLPDTELRAAATSGRLREDSELVAEVRRMLLDPKVRRLGREFGCGWLHVADLEQSSEKSERHFPTFTALRGAMQEEVTQFFTAVFQQGAPVRDLLDADYAYLDPQLAEHYGIPGVTGAGFRRVDGVKAYARGGILGFAATLAVQSGASRTSPILRGNWVCEALLADKLPKPPKDVPKLPEDESSESLSIRELVERHSKDPSCARCHERMDAFGFALENFDAIGRFRVEDLGGHRIDSRARTLDGSEFEGIAGLRDYLLTKRRADFEAQFVRKLLGYALGRATQLSDQPLLEAIASRSDGGRLRISDVVEAIVLSPQFRMIRGREFEVVEEESR